MMGTNRLTLRAVTGHKFFPVAVLLAAAITILTTSVLLSIKHVAVTVDGTAYLSFNTLDRTVQTVLSKKNITLGEYDEVSPPLSANLKRNQAIEIKRAFPLTVTVGSETREIQTVRKELANVLQEKSIELGEMDIVSPPLDSIVDTDTVIAVTKVTADMVPVEEAIPFETVSTANSSLERGKTKVITEGVEGVKELMYKVTYHNGEEVSRELAGERIISEPQSRVEQYGTQYYELSSRGGRVVRDSRKVEDPAEQLNYTQALTCTATAYDLSYQSCGKNPGDPYYGIAASGMKISRGVVAVDPRVIPMGSKLYIQSLDSFPDYGFAIAGDKGGAIKGNKVDLFMESSSEVYSFGRRQVKVYILTS